MSAQVVVLTGGRAAASVLSAMWFVLLAHRLTPAGLGNLTLLLGLGAIFGVVGDAGLSNVLLHRVAANPSNAEVTVREILVRRCILSLGAATATGVAFVVSGEGVGWIEPMIYAASLMATAVYSSQLIGLRALGYAQWEAANEVLSRIAIVTVGAVVLFKLSASLTAAVSMYAGVDIASALVVSHAVKRRHCFVSRVNDTVLHPAAGEKRINLAAREVGPYAVAAGIWTIYYRIDLWLLSILDSSTAVARYAAAYRIFEALLIPASSAAAMAIPVMARRSSEWPRRLKQLGVGAAGMTAVAALVIGLTATKVVTVLFGSRYAVAAGPLRWLAAGSMASALAAVAQQAVTVIDGRLVVVVSTAALVGNIVLNIVLIPAYGPNGAAIATGVCQIGVATALWRRLTKAWRDREPAT